MHNFHLFTSEYKKHGLDESLIKSNMLEKLSKKISENYSIQDLILFLKIEHDLNYYKQSSKYKKFNSIHTSS